MQTDKGVIEMASVGNDQKIAGSYDLKFQIEKEIGKTKEQMAGDEQIIPAIGEAILEELEKQLLEVQDKIEERWNQADAQGETFGVQATFGFYWECAINTEEIPF